MVALAHLLKACDYKLIRAWFDGPDRSHAYELYNLRDDLGEQHNLADVMPDKVIEMAALLDEWLSATGAPLPVRNPNFDPAAKKPVIRNAAADGPRRSERRSPRNTRPAASDR